MQTNWTTFLRDGPRGVKNIGGMDVLIFLFSSKRIWNIKAHLKHHYLKKVLGGEFNHFLLKNSLIQ